MSSPRKTFRLIVLTLIGVALTACHFHGHRCGGFRHRPPVRICR